MLEYLNRNAGAVQALAAVLTVLLALGALIGVKLQIDAADRIQRGQSARDIYREYLNLAMGKPEFAQPDFCKISGTAAETSYAHYVEYMLYTSEQVIASDPTWNDVFIETYKEHAPYLCSVDPKSYDEPVQALLRQLRETSCKSVKPCT
jgi:hypothetical protein